jgi:adenine-specific DNA-methyltransferase
MVISYNDESWVGKDHLLAMCERFEEVRFLAFDSKRYVGAQIGIFNPDGEVVGEVSHLRNKEWVVVAGPRDVVKKMTDHVVTDHLGNVVPASSRQPKLF